VACEVTWNVTSPNEINIIGRITKINLSHFRYVDLPDTQQILAENQEVLSKLLWLTSNGSGTFQKEVAAKTLFCCSNHPKAARKIIENQCYRLVLEKAQVLELAREDPSALPFTAGVV
jgi:hypothetical protein